MKIDYKSMFIGVALGVVGVFSVLFLLGDVKTEFSVKTGEHAKDMNKEINVRIEKTVEDEISREKNLANLTNNKKKDE